MAGRWIQNHREGGIARIEPRLAVPDAFDRFLFITPVMFTALGYFLAGALPVQVFAAIAASCFVGDALIALKQLLRAETRELARVTELPPRRR